MSFIKLFAFLVSMIYVVESAVCPQDDSCQHNYGRRLTPQAQALAQFLAYTTVPQQTASYDPIPCCLNCYAQPGCDYYYLNFLTGNCTLYSLPKNNQFILNLASGRFYQKYLFNQTCIGFANSYLFSNM